MKNLVISSVFIVLLAAALRVGAKPQDSSTNGEAPANETESKFPDLESEDSQNRFFIANPPRQEVQRPGNFVRFGTQRRPNLPWQTSPRSLNIKPAGSLEILPEYKGIQHEDYSDNSNESRMETVSLENKSEPQIHNSSERLNELTLQRKQVDESTFLSNATAEDVPSGLTIPWKYVLNREFELADPIPHTKFELPAFTTPEMESNTSNNSNYETNLHGTLWEDLNENDEYDYDYRDIYTDTDEYDHDKAMNNYTDDLQSDRDESIDIQDTTMNPNADRHPRQGLNHNLRLHSFQNTYPFESEVRGEGYHSRIRFDPFGVVPQSGEPYPITQTFGNWRSRPSNEAPPADTPPRHQINPTAFRSSETFGSGEHSRPSSFEHPEYSHHLPQAPHGNSGVPVSDPTLEYPGFSHQNPEIPVQDTSFEYHPTLDQIPQAPQGSSEAPLTDSSFGYHGNSGVPVSDPSLEYPRFSHQIPEIPVQDTSSEYHPTLDQIPQAPQGSSEAPLTDSSSGYHPSQPINPTYRPPQARPFVHPGNLAALLEGAKIRDPSSSPPEGLTQDQNYSNNKAKNTPDFDYPIVANVFHDETKVEVISGDLIAYGSGETDSITSDFDTSTASFLPNDGHEHEANEEVSEHIPLISDSITEPSVILSASRTAQTKGNTDGGIEEVKATSTSTLDFNSDYYDLYDEFMEMYYDTEDYSQSSEPKTQQPHSPLSETTSPAPLPILPDSSSLSSITGEIAISESSVSISLTSAELDSTTDINSSSTSPTSSIMTTELTSPSTAFTEAATSSTTSTSTTTATTTTTTPQPPTTPSTLATIPSSAIVADKSLTIPELVSTTEAQDKPLLLGDQIVVSKSGNEPQSSGSSASKPATPKFDPERTTEENITKPTSQGSSEPTGPNKGGTLISLSEILQGIGMSLPQFLVALKGHGLTLKEFTLSLQQKSLTQQQFKRSKGDLSSLLEMLRDNPTSSSKVAEELLEEREEETEKKFSITPYWLTSRPTWRPSTTTTSTTTTTTTTTTAEPSTTTRQPSTSAPPPKIFGFMPTFSEKINMDTKNKSAAETEVPDTSKAPIPIKLDIASIMKDKGLSASDILHDLGSLFTFGNDSGSERIFDDKEILETNGGGPEENAVTEDSTESRGEKTSTSKPYSVPEAPMSLRPYNPSGGSERYRPRPYRPNGEGAYGGVGNRGILTNRFQTTERTTLLPPYQPPPVKQTGEISSLLNILHNSTTNTAGGSISFGLPIDDDAVPGIPFSDNTHPRSSSNNNYYPVFDNDPDSLHVSTKSAILAASILGGVAMCVFLAILVVVMYRGRARRRKPLTLQSDTSSSSTPPIYSTRVSGGKGNYKTSGFWGTLKKRFDPYSLSPTPTVMT